MEVDKDKAKKYGITLKYRLDGTGVKDFKGKLSMFPLPFKYTATKDSFYEWGPENSKAKGSDKRYHANFNDW